MVTKTIRQALVDDVFYPLPPGFVNNRLLTRGLDGDAEADAEAITSFPYLGAVADCLAAVLEQGVTYSEADKTVQAIPAASLAMLKRRVDKLYKRIGEGDGGGFDLPQVSFL